MTLNRTRIDRAFGVVAAGCIAAGGVAALTTPAQAQGGTSVSNVASPWTPFLASANSNVSQLVPCGSQMFAVGTFSRIGSPLTSTVYTRHNAFSFDATTGRVSNWHPNVHGTVHSIALSADCRKVYLAGNFKQVNAQRRHYLVKVNGTSGKVYKKFKAKSDDVVSTVVRVRKRLMVGGKFSRIGGADRSVMASLRRKTGKASGYLDLPVTGHIAGPSGVKRITKFEVNPDGSRMVVMGNFASVNGHARQQIFMLHLKKSDPVTLRKWNSPSFALACKPEEPFYVRAAAWSPDGKNVYIATTGDRGLSDLCDAAVAFSSSNRSDHRKLWANYTGCDSLYAIAADAQTVYFGGHERWIDNPFGCDTKVAPAKDRQGVGAVKSSNGKSAAWNPGRSRGLGADDMLRTSAGLWIASDNGTAAHPSTKCGGSDAHAGICFLPNG